MPIKKNILIFVLKMKEIYILKLCYTHDFKKKFAVHKIVLFKAVNITISNPSFFLTSIPFKRND